MTPEAFVAKLNERIATLNEAEIIFPIAAKVHEMQITRIFDKGQNAQGNQLGTYSTKSEYYSKKQFKNKSGFKGIGKNGDTKFKNGEPHKSMFIEDGYKGLKGNQGYENSFVNLTYSTDLRQDFSTGLTQRGASYVGILKHQSIGKIGGLKNKYGRIFAFAPAEIELFKTEGARALNKFLFGVQTYQ